MTEHDIEDIRSWVNSRALAGADEQELLRGFSARCEKAGLALSTTAAVVNTLHPIWKGRAFFWQKAGLAELPVVEYDNSLGMASGEHWQNSVFRHMLEIGAEEYRCHFASGERAPFNWFNQLISEGHTDYLAFIHRFAGGGAISEMDAVYSHWSTNGTGGFSDQDCDALRRLMPALALALKCASVCRAAETLAEVYLGRGAGSRVLRGSINRGMSEQIRAVLWFSDLKGYTKISDLSDPLEVIPLLNDYADAVISAVHEHGGDVVKLIGDGILAIFPDADEIACSGALQAAVKMKELIRDLNIRRADEGRPTTTVRLGLHIGEVFFGNIGSNERLDFTVVGPAVNEVSRITAMGLSVDRDFLVSDAFFHAVPDYERQQFASVGRFALRGVRRICELYTSLEIEMSEGREDFGRANERRSSNENDDPKAIHRRMQSPGGGVAEAGKDGVGSSA